MEFTWISNAGDEIQTGWQRWIRLVDRVSGPTIPINITIYLVYIFFCVILCFYPFSILWNIHIHTLIHTRIHTHTHCENIGKLTKKKINLFSFDFHFHSIYIRIGKMITFGTYTNMEKERKQLLVHCVNKMVFWKISSYTMWLCVCVCICVC